MKILRLAICAAVIAITPIAANARGGGGHSGASHSSAHSATSSYGAVNSHEHLVSGYTRANGTYVAPHYQTDPNGTRNDNFSTRGNINPHTGEVGDKPRDEDPH